MKFQTITFVVLVLGWLANPQLAGATADFTGKVKMVYVRNLPLPSMFIRLDPPMGTGCTGEDILITDNPNPNFYERAMHSQALAYNVTGTSVTADIDCSVTPPRLHRIRNKL